jgi:hypothetical protein
MRHARIMLIVLMLIKSMPIVSHAEQKTSNANIASVLPVFRPKNLGAPKVRVGGGSRGLDQNTVELFLFAPEEAGLTLQSQPTLYWYVSKPVDLPVEITITDKFSVILKTTLSQIKTSGVQSLSLAEQHVNLQPDILYKWSVAIVNDPDQRSLDTFASAGIIAMPPQVELDAEMLALNDPDRIMLLAHEGFWYDAMAAVYFLINNNTDKSFPAAMRASLLQQVGLKSP